jgi:hypothetical protein
MLISQFLRYPPDTHFVELKVTMHCRTVLTLICFAVSWAITLLLWRISYLAHSSFYVVVAVVGQPKHSASVKFIWPFLNISIHSYTNLQERVLSPYWAHMLWWICSPGTPYAHKNVSQSFLFHGAILKFRCHVHCLIETLSLTTRSQACLK